MKFRKKPVVIDAELFDRSQPWPAGVCGCKQKMGPLVHSLEGAVSIDDGSWVITGVKGEKYSIRGDIFQETYDAVEG